jgi:heme exporter protein D
MLIELLTMNGYGQYVWPAFVFSFISCFYLYIKTKAELKKQESNFSLKFHEEKKREIVLTEPRKSTEEALSIN